jgi:exopolysaccharide biosynthesis polyprenyl glycosylphosphotransferase
MLRRFSLNFAIFSMVVDLACIASMLYASGYIRPLLSVYLQELPLIRDVNKAMRLPEPLYVAFPLLWVTVMLFFNVYDGEKNLRIVDEFTSLTLSALLAGVALAGVLYLSYRETSRLLFLFFVTATYLALLLWRLPARLLYRQRRLAQRSVSRILIVGAGPLGREVQSLLSAPTHLPLEVIGFLDDDPQKQAQHADILGNVDEARAVVQKFSVQHVVIALPPRAYQRVNNVVTDLFDLPVETWVIPDYFHLTLHHAAVRELGSIPMLNLRAPALSSYQRMIKRVFDLMLVIPSLPFVLPVMGIIALLILLDDGSPVFFRQQRVGENGRLFTVYKFRTMVRNAEDLRHLVEEVDEHGNLIHKKPDDPRVTRIGRFLRRLSLDELPQLFNVLRGEMSLVGPRPELPYLVEKYQPWQRKRFAVPQGITGWWQIHGRSDKPMHLHTEDDLYYIQNYSIWLDIRILIRTIWIVLRGKGAY